ncbi:MAG TPA: YbaB/EbfC family nucleoid-associated protein [Synergistaceae bacterium]|nr:YbaB/EbfC family nucleoid-associated protein [Synergistaceae bacterium]HQH77445.1 YbaB/EbfC family nucleoid-associated protein [Synergistaceae bacterium]HQK23984.1 YbaB/EbfC family nucleoid-associated protein [Synergistaceae bacterium]
MKMDKILKQAQKMQAQMLQMQEELAKVTVEGAAGGGMVRAVANAQGEVLSVKIAPEVVDPQEIDMLEDLVLAAVNEALRLGKEKANRQMEQVTGGMGLSMPGLF